MGGTGLEPVTPSLSRAAVRVSSRAFAQAAWLSGIHPATERLSETERTLILAILATPAARLLAARPSGRCVGTASSRASPPPRSPSSGPRLQRMNCRRQPGRAQRRKRRPKPARGHGTPPPRRLLMCPRLREADILERRQEVGNARSWGCSLTLRRKGSSRKRDSSRTRKLRHAGNRRTRPSRPAVLLRFLPRYRSGCSQAERCELDFLTIGRTLALAT